MKDFPELNLGLGRSIGAGRTFLIAEVGSNHAGSLETALESIDAAAECGADAVKFQSIRLEELYHRPSEAVRDLHRKIDLPEEWHAPLKERCDERQVVFFSSPTYLKSIDLLESLDVALYKLASAQVAVFPQLVRRVAALGKPVILSSGLVTEDELERTIRIFEEFGNEQFVVLHCNSVYPAPPEIVRLPRMLDYGRRFGSRVGFSDHTLTNTASVAAVALGACVIERHFTLSRSLHSPDAPLSLEPEDFATFTRTVREAEAVCDAAPRISLEKDESEFREVIRHCPVASKDISPGDLFGEFNTTLMRGRVGGTPDAWEWHDLCRVSSPVSTRLIRAGEWISVADYCTRSRNV